MKEINWIPCKVIAECGYHDIHKAGEVINVEDKHLNEMLSKGYVKMICHSCGTNEEVKGQARIDGSLKPMCRNCMSGFVGN